MLMRNTGGCGSRDKVGFVAWRLRAAPAMLTQAAPGDHPK
jgi:hypothetical protein